MPSHLRPEDFVPLFFPIALFVGALAGSAYVWYAEIEKAPAQNPALSSPAGPAGAARQSIPMLTWDANVTCTQRADGSIHCACKEGK